MVHGYVFCGLYSKNNKYYMWQFAQHHTSNSKLEYSSKTCKCCDAPKILLYYYFCVCRMPVCRDALWSPRNHSENVIDCIWLTIAVKKAKGIFITPLSYHHHTHNYPHHHHSPYNGVLSIQAINMCNDVPFFTVRYCLLPKKKKSDLYFKMPIESIQ